MEKANILVLGTSGAGKSTLINTVIGAQVAKVGNGKHITEEMKCYESPDLNFRLIDSRGFEYSTWNTRKTVMDMRKWLREGLQDKKPRIHMLWFCVDATSKRFTKQTVRTLETVKKEWKDVPIIVVLTKSFFPAEDSENIRMVEETFRKFAKKTGMPVAVIPVLAEAPKGEEILPRGIEQLIRITEEHLDDAVKDSDEAVRRFDIKYKRIKAHGLTAAASLTGAIVGAVPIAFPDAVILTPLEAKLITSISKIYGLNQSDDDVKKVITRIIEAGTVSVIARAAINQLKMVPGLVNLAADVLNAIVAGSIIFAIGESTIVIMEKVNSGEIDPDSLEWIDNIVEGKMGAVIKKVTGIISHKGGNINATEIIKELLKK